MKKKNWVMLGMLAWAVLSTPARAVDGMSFELGNGDGADMARVGVQWDWNKRWLQGREWHVGGYWDLALGYWTHGNTLPGQNDDLVEIGLTPVFRVQRNDLAGLYGEIGIGAHLLSKTSLAERHFSTAFQFGNHIGAGYRFGARGAFDFGYRFQHLSNAGIKRPNQGINFHQIRLQYRF